MFPIKCSLDSESFSTKPNNNVIMSISKRIGGCPYQINTPAELQSFAKKVGAKGYTFCPATFSDKYRHQESFAQQQLIAMDFDNDNPKKTVTFDTIKSRADYYDLCPLFAYSSLRSTTSHPKFRVVFLNDIPISDQKVAKAMQLALGEIFPEADRSCYSDVSKLYLGGKELIYYDNTLPVIDLDTLFRSLNHYFKKIYGSKHYKEKIKRFSNKTGIALTNKGLLDIVKADGQVHLTEVPGATTLSKNGGNSPSAIIMSKIGHGENPPYLYSIRFNDSNDRDRCTSKPSVGVISTENHSDNHKQYRSSIIDNIRCFCRLFRELENGERKLKHHELFGIMTSLINVETGSNLFTTILSKYPELYDKPEKWKDDVQYCSMQDYRPQKCEKFCIYHEECPHAKNMLITATPHSNSMEKDPYCDEKYYSLEEAQEDVYNAILNAYRSTDDLIHIIKAQVGIGKTHSYLRIMDENPNVRFLIAAPTNLLKNEIYKKARGMNIDVYKTPSLEEIKDKLPQKVWKKIQWYYKRGLHSLVHTYIQHVLAQSNIPCLRKYMEARDKIKTAKGCVITTHRYMLTMEEARLKEFDTIIIDEDIIFKSIITNQKEISLSDLKKLSGNTTDCRLRQKIKNLLKQAKARSCVELDSFEYDIKEEDGVSNNKKSVPLDIPSFCKATHFYIRKVEKERNLTDDTVVFLKLDTLKHMKYIVVSATADEDIYCQFFGEDKIDFYECKQAKYKGELLQYPDKSMSRSSIDNNQGIVRRLMQYFNLNESHVITFMKENIGFLHFGNTEGSNALEGEDILVVGTPYHADFMYKLIAFSVGLDFNEDEEMTPQPVKRNGYIFRINTFTDEDPMSFS